MSEGGPASIALICCEWNWKDNHMSMVIMMMTITIKRLLMNCVLSTSPSGAPPGGVEGLLAVYLCVRKSSVGTSAFRRDFLLQLTSLFYSLSAVLQFNDIHLGIAHLAGFVHSTQAAAISVEYREQQPRDSRRSRACPRTEWDRRSQTSNKIRPI